MNDVIGNRLKPGDKVAYATTTRPGHSKHAVLKVGTVRKIDFGTAGEYVLVDVREGDETSATVIRESQKLVRLETK